MTHSRIVFAGTPEFACPALAALISRQRPMAVLTQPDRPAGRGRRLVASPVKRLAAEAGIKVLQPDSLKPADVHQALSALKPDLLVTAAYGLLLPRKVLDLPALGCWNLHASLLPRWRGASPIQQAIRAGDERTGISLMQMDSGLDTGPVRIQAELAIGPEETAAELHDRLAALAADLLRDALARRAHGTLPEPVAQNDAEATHAPRILKEDAHIDWTADAATVARHIHAYNPWPVAFTELVDQPIRIFRARPVELDVGAAAPGQLLTGRGAPDELRVACGRGALSLLELQAPGKRRMSVADWLNARPEWRG